MVEIARKKYRLYESLGFASRGIGKAIKKERNLKIHLAATFLVTVFGFWLKISTLEWLAIIIICALIISMEILNSSIEAVCDLLRFKLNLSYYETYWVRNFAAGAVMILALGAIIIGLIIFLPKILFKFS